MLSRTDKVIVLFSGGIDSTALLYRLLSRTEAVVHAHHVHLINVEGRFTCEKIAVERLVPYLRAHTRAFEYSESTFASNALRYSGMDIITALYCGALAAQDDLLNHRDSAGRPRYQYKVAVGDNAGTYQADSWPSPMAHMIFQAASLSHPRNTQYIPQLIQPIVHLTKRQLIEELPPALLDLTWSCRRPRYLKDKDQYVECAECHSCEELKTLGLLKGKVFKAGGR